MTFKRCLGSLLNFPRNNEHDRKQKRDLSTLNNLQAVLAAPMVLPEISLRYRLPKNNFLHLERNTEMKRLGMLKCLMRLGDFSSLNSVAVRRYNTCVQAADLDYVHNKNMITDKANYKNCKLVSYLPDHNNEPARADNLSTSIAARNVKSLPFTVAKLTGMKQQRSQGDEYLRQHDVYPVEKYHASKISATEANAVRGETQQRDACFGSCRFDGLPCSSGNLAKQGSHNPLSPLSSLSPGPRRMFSSRSYVVAQKWPRTIGISGQDSNNANVPIPLFRRTQSYTGILRFYRFILAIIFRNVSIRLSLDADEMLNHVGWPITDCRLSLVA